MLINNNLFILEEIPKLHPESLEYMEFWKEQKIRCVNGYWIGGRWIPGNLYFYVNFWNILLNKTEHSKTKSLGKPFLRDIEWMMIYGWMRARGLSGWEKFPNPTEEQLLDILENGSKMGDLGYPLFERMSRDFMLMGARGTGKSFFVAGAVVGHEFIFDGAKRYYHPDDENYEKLSAEIVVGAGEAKYSKLLLDKVKLGIDNLEGGFSTINDIYPPPFYKQYTGSWTVNFDVVARYEKRTAGRKETMGSGSTIKHRTFMDNPYAASGTRGTVNVREEIGLFKNLKASYEPSVETMMNGAYKFGSVMYIGTGGDMDAGTLDAYEMFYSPDTYTLVPYEDVWENKGKTAFFLPAYLGLNQYKKNGNTDVEAANKYLSDFRENLKVQKNASSKLDAELQNRPIVPSEVFLRSNVNIFPVAELKDWLATLETRKIYEDAEHVCELVFDENGNVDPRINTSLNPIRKFPLDRDDDPTGAVTIFHHPMRNDDGEITFGRYLAGIDPYDHNKSSTNSLGSIIVFDKLSERIVAEYSGRPKFATTFYENCRRLLIYYNGLALYENEKVGVKQYFEKKNSLHLLMKQPKYIKDIVPSSTVERGFGIHMSMSIKDHGEILLRDWLQDEYEEGMLNVRKIRSVPLLKELVMYDSDSNFDRAIAMICVMYAINETHKMKVDYAMEKTKTETFFEKRLFSKGKFRNL